MRAIAHLKPMVQAKPFYGFKIVWVHNHDTFWGLGVVFMTWDNFFQQIKI